jgi:hypothetical protein
MEVCDVWLARDFLRRTRRPLDIPPCTCPPTLCPPIKENEMTTTTAPTDLDTLNALLDAMPDGPWRVAQSLPFPGIRTAAGWEVVYASYADTAKVLEFIAAARNTLPALLDELAKTRAELEQATQQRNNFRDLAIRINQVRGDANPATTAAPAAEPKPTPDVSTYYSSQTGSHGWRCATCGNESRPIMPAHAAEDVMRLHRCTPVIAAS